MNKLALLLKSITYAHSMQLASGIMMVAAISVATVKVHTLNPTPTPPPAAKVVKVVAAKKKTPPPPKVVAKPAPKPKPVEKTVAVAPAPAVVPKAVPKTAPTSVKPGKTVSSLTPTASTGGTGSGTTSSSGTSSSGTSSSSSSSSSGSTTTWTPSARYTSTNWSGYLAKSASYTTVSGSWIAPTPTGNNTSTSADATWIGIGGVTSQDLIQTGTENTVTASGQVEASVFYEMLPAAAVYPAGITVNPGDSISASITETSPSQWAITVFDATDGQTFNITVSYTSTNSSAEWIEEDPSYASGGLVPFDYFGTAAFSSGKTTADGISQSIGQSIPAIVYLVDSKGNNLATPSDITSDGGGFTVTRSTN